jgi:hypothetical protein
MCLIMLCGFVLMVVLVGFIKSAQILLPWTVGAAVLAGLCAVGLGRLVGGPKARGRAVAALSAFGLTMGFGYLGYWLMPPKAPPQKQGVELMVEMPEPTQKDLHEILPIHLAISAIISAAIASRAVHLSSRDSNQSPETKGTTSGAAQERAPEKRSQ